MFIEFSVKKQTETDTLICVSISICFLVYHLSFPKKFLKTGDKNLLFQIPILI